MDPKYSNIIKRFSTLAGLNCIKHSTAYFSTEQETAPKTLIGTKNMSKLKIELC